MATLSSFSIWVFLDVGAAETEGDRIQINAAHLVANEGRTLHLIDRIGTLDTLDRRLFEEVVIDHFLVELFRLLLKIADRQDIVADRHIQDQRGQIKARIAPDIVFVRVIFGRIGEEHFAPIRQMRERWMMSP